MDGQNHIVAVTPLKFHAPEEFENRQKSVYSDRKSAIEMSSMPKIASEIIEKKKKARQLKEKGNIAFKKKKFEEAEKCYSQAIQLNMGFRPFWTNRASCRNVMKKYQEAISDQGSKFVHDFFRDFEVEIRILFQIVIQHFLSTLNAQKPLLKREMHCWV